MEAIAGAAIRGASPEKVVMLFVLLADFVMSVGFVFFFFANPVDYNLSTFEAAEYLDLSFIWVQLAAALLDVVFSFVSLSLVLRPVEEKRQMSRWMVVAVIKMATVFVNLAYWMRTSPSREGFETFFMQLRLLEVLLLVLAAFRVRTSHMAVPVDPDDVNMAPSFKNIFQDKDGRPSLERLEKFLEVRSVRQSIRYELSRGHQYMFWFCGFIAALWVANFCIEFNKTVGTEAPFWDDAALERMNDGADAYFGDAPLQKSTKLILVVVSGLRYDTAATSDAWQSVFGQGAVQRDTKVLKLQANLPSQTMPAWLGMLSGTSAEFHGVWGNQRLPETKLDTVFAQSKSHGFQSAATGSPWLIDLVRNQLPDNFYGEGSAAPPYEITAGPPALFDTDRRRASNVLTMLKQTSTAGSALAKLYHLVMVQLDDVSAQGQSQGAASAAYHRAVSNTSTLLQEIINSMDADTALAVTADHGMIDRGGWGGDDAKAVDVPLYVYKANSNLGIRPPFSAIPRFNPDPIRPADLTATLSAILGLPVPRQQQGVFIDDLMQLASQPMLLMHYRDLFKQRQALVTEYLTQVGMAHVVGNHSVLTEPALEGLDLKEYRDKILEVNALFAQSRGVETRRQEGRNWWASVGAALFLGLALLYIVQRFTFVDLSVVIAPVAGQYNNRRALFFSLWAVVLYFAGALILFRWLCSRRGYTRFSASLVHYPTELLVFVLNALFPACVGAFVLVRSYHFPYMVTDAWRAGAVPAYRLRRWAYYLREYVRYLLLGSNAQYSDLAMIYLCKYYLLLISMGVVLILFVVQAKYTFIVPLVFRMQYVPLAQWGFRFHCLVLQLVSLPLVLANLLMLVSWPDDSLSKPHYDKLYALCMLKNERRNGPGGKGEDILGMLEEETEALLQSKFSINYDDEKDFDKQF